MLPGLDDGAVDWEDAVSMAVKAADDGIKKVVCTPHWVCGLLDNNRKVVFQAIELFKEELDKRGIDLEVYPGAELSLHLSLPEKLETGEVLTLNGTKRYALVELPAEIVPPGIENFFFQLESMGITPILAHPERNFALIESPQKLYAWVQMGVLTQITAGSLLGRFGTAVRKFSVFLMEHRMVHILATDAHGPKTRAPRLSGAVKEASRIVGDDAARRMVSDRPLAIIRGEALVCPDPIPIAGRNRGNIFRRIFSLLNLQPN